MRFEPDVEALLGHSAPSKDMAIGGAYEGADRTSRELSLWSPALRSADADIFPDKQSSDARSRDLSRNDAYVQSGQSLHKDNIVGSRFTLNAKPEFSILGQDETWAEEFQEEAEQKFTLWAESPANWVDARRTKNFTAMVRLVVGTYVVTNEALAVVQWLRDKPRTFNTAIQLVDTDRLSTPYDVDPTVRVRGGIEQNAYGAPQAAYIRNAHPSDIFDFTNLQDAYQWTRVPWTKPWGRPQVIYIAEEQRVDQTRGISDMVAALKEMKMTKRFREMVLQNAVVNATYAATIESELPSDQVFAQLGGGQGTAALGGGKDGTIGVAAGLLAGDYGAAYLTGVNEYLKNAKANVIDGVKIPHLFPGTKLNIRSPGVPGGPGQDFEASLMRYIAANLHVSYEQLSMDYSKSNYSSIRAAAAETWKFMQARKKMVADRFASIVYRLWLEEAINKNLMTTVTPRMLAKANFYDGLNTEAYTACEWIGASRGQVDELKETQAAVLRMNNNLSTQEDEVARFGGDWRKLNAQRQREIKDQTTRNILPAPTDPALNAASGTADKVDENSDNQKSKAA